MKINFKKKTNFYEISSFSKLKKIDAYLILKQAFAQNKLFEDDKEFLTQQETVDVSKDQVNQ